MRKDLVRLAIFFEVKTGVHSENYSLMEKRESEVFSSALCLYGESGRIANKDFH